MSIKIGILGYGNLGRGVECAVKHNPDMELTAVFTRRNPADVQILTETWRPSGWQGIRRQKGSGCRRRHGWL